MIALEHISKSYGKQNLLENITFSVKEGERVSLLGPGGCGKSTILKIMLGLVEPDGGSAKLMDFNLQELDDEHRRNILKKVGMAFQQGALFDFMTVHDNLKFAMENMTNFSRDDIDARIKRLLEGVKLSKAEFQYPYELSGGMQRRVGIARALGTDPVLAIFDEPTSGLDPVTSTIILNMILELSHPESLQFIATSNVEIAIRFAERVIIVFEGKVVADGLWRQLIMEGPDWVRNFLSVRLIGLDREYAEELKLPPEFIRKHWK